MATKGRRNTSQVETDETKAELDRKQTLLNSLTRKLNYFNKTSEGIISAGKMDKMQRQYSHLKTKLEEVYDLIRDIQGLYLDQDESEELIDNWTAETEGGLKPFENAIEKLNLRITEEENRKVEMERKQKLDFETEMRKNQVKEEQEAERGKQMRKEKFTLELEQKKLLLAEKSKINSKLPDLHISKFQGTHLDWVRFWGIFETQIDQSTIKPEAKFSYLKEFVVPKVKVIIDKLPPNSEGYNKAKEILVQRYGDTSEVINAHIQQILTLPIISGTSRPKIHDFYDQLLCNVQALETLGKLNEVKGNVRMTLDKLDGIRADLTRTDPKWKEWDFNQLLEALREWIDRNPLQVGEKQIKSSPRDQYRHEKNYVVKEVPKLRQCIYCENPEHKATDCTVVRSVDERRKILSDKKLCFNCTGGKHRANDCRSRISCQYCQKRHHTSICDGRQSAPLLTATNQRAVIHPVVILQVDGVSCRALLDTGSSSSYISTRLSSMINKPPVRQECKSIEMMLQKTVKKIDVYDVSLSDIDGKFSIRTEVNGVDKDVLLMLPNPHYSAVIEENPHLRGVKMNDIDKKESLPIHAILGASDFALIKTSTAARIGDLGQPVAEKTKFGWVIMSPGQGHLSSTLMLARSSTEDYMQLCSLDVLGLEDKPEGDQGTVYEEFKEQLTQGSDGKYQTSLPWKAGHPALPTNYKVAKGRFNSLVRKLESNPEMLANYHEIIQNQLNEGIVEKAPESLEGNIEHYIPHRAILRENAETTKLRIVYDASAKADESSPSLNECLETGPPLQRKIMNILLRTRFKPVFLAGDVKQAFLQIQIRKAERDALRFIWIDNLQSKGPMIYRFTRVLFGLSASPFLLGGTLEQHFAKFTTKYPDCVRELREGIYVDDISLGAISVEETKQLKDNAVAIFKEGGFTLHKWHSNAKELEGEFQHKDETSFAKESLGTKQTEVKLLGVGWNKDEDTLVVTIPQHEEISTKRTVLRTIAKVYDPLGIVSPILLTAKILFRDICDRKLSWDGNLPDDLLKRWQNWTRNLPTEVKIPRSIPLRKSDITGIELHGFADASLNGCAAVIYAIVRQGSDVNQHILVAKSRLSKRDLTIPRLELVSCHMLSNLLLNTAEALEGLNIVCKQAWTDSTVCLYWILGGGAYKQFVTNRVRKIKQHQDNWRYVSTGENPADIGSRGALKLQENAKWKEGPAWLRKQENWPPEIPIKASEESENERKLLKEIIHVNVERESDEIDNLVEKKSFWKAVRILSWMKRFINNCRRKSSQGPLTTDETIETKFLLIKRAQSDVQDTESFKRDSERLNLERNDNDILICKGRIQGDYPIYLPFRNNISAKLVEQAHLQTLHGGVALTMAKVRDYFWIPKLRSIVKRIIKACHGCKRFHTTACPTPPQGNLPKERTEGTLPFDVVGVDFAGPIMYRGKGKSDRKGYIILYTCSWTRAVHIEFLPSMTTGDFLRSLKRFIAVRGKPKKIISDNGKTFVAASKWISKIQRDERLQDYLAENVMKWQFNLSRASWWGGLFERMISIVKGALYKTVGSAKVTFTEMEEILIDIQLVINNRPLSYCEDDIELPVLTPNMLIHGKSIYTPEEEPSSRESKDLRNRAKYLLRCKEALRKRWRSEYVRALRERHNLKHPGKQADLKRGDIVMIKGEEKNRARWKIGKVTDMIQGRDGVVRVVKVLTANGELERPIQFLYPLELSCNTGECAEPRLNANAKEFRPKRRAADDAIKNIHEICNYELNEEL